MPQNLHNDEPTIADCFGRKKFIEKVGEMIGSCTPPQMVGIHGDWGSGKTSALRQIQFYLTADSPYDYSASDIRPRGDAKEFVAVWFEAWRYQQEGSPIIALLQEIRSQLPFAKNALHSFKKIGEVSVRSALDIFDLSILRLSKSGTASTIQQHGEAYEARHFETALPSEAIRQGLEKAIKEIIGKKKLIIFVDDLDRCQPDVAYRLLEGIKIYLNLSNCVVVFGMNQRAVERALSISMERTKIADSNNPASYEAQEYITKICQNIIHIPSINIKDGLNRWINKNDISHKDLIIYLIDEYKCLPTNPRKVKAFANALHSHTHKLNELSPRADREAEENVKSFLVMLFLYLDYQPIFRRVVAYEPFYDDVLRPWCRGDTGGPKPEPGSAEERESAARVESTRFEELFKDYLPTSIRAFGGAPGTDELKSLYPDPAYGPYFRPQRLVAETPLREKDITIWRTP